MDATQSLLNNSGIYQTWIGAKVTQGNDVRFVNSGHLVPSDFILGDHIFLDGDCAVVIRDVCFVMEECESDQYFLCEKNISLVAPTETTTSPTTASNTQVTADSCSRFDV